MFFKSSKKETKKAEKKELIYRENIKVNCKPDTQENVIREVGKMLVDTGYVGKRIILRYDGNEKHMLYLKMATAWHFHTEWRRPKKKYWRLELR